MFRTEFTLDVMSRKVLQGKVYNGLVSTLGGYSKRQESVALEHVIQLYLRGHDPGSIPGRARK
jgi:hypothetical protein